MAIEVLPATVDRFVDVASLIAPWQEGAPACWCLYFRLPSAEFGSVRGAERPDLAVSLISPR